MSADNALFVIPSQHSQGFMVVHGCLSAIPSAEEFENISFLEVFPTKDEALIGAKEISKDFEYLQYGVIDLCAPN